MMQLRKISVAFVMALLMCLALCTTGAFAQSAHTSQVSQRAVHAVVAQRPRAFGFARGLGLGRGLGFARGLGLGRGLGFARGLGLTRGLGLGLGLGGFGLGGLGFG